MLNLVVRRETNKLLEVNVKLFRFLRINYLKILELYGSLKMCSKQWACVLCLYGNETLYEYVIICVNLKKREYFSFAEYLRHSLVSNQPHIHCVNGVFPCVKWPEREAGH
jgi:hypothetical protein